MLALVLLLAGCGGGSLAGGGSSTGVGPGGGGGSSSTGLALGLRIASLGGPSASPAPSPGGPITQILVDLLDPVTLQSLRPTTVVNRNGQDPQNIELDSVSPGTYVVRLQGRDAQGHNSGSRAQAPAVVPSGGVAQVSVTLNSDQVLTSLQITPPAPTLQAATSLQLQAIGIFSDQSTQDLTSQVTWSSDQPAVATVSSQGILTGLSPGTSLIRAGLSGITAQATATVAQAALKSLEISPLSPTVAAGMTQAFQATGVFADGTRQDLTSQVAWSSSNLKVATITPQGLAQALAAGSTQIQAAFQGLQASTVMNVTGLVQLTLSPLNPNLPLGAGTQFSATGTFSDGTTRDLTNTVTWSSSNNAVASINSSGAAQSLAQGSTVIQASTGSLASATNLTVLPAALTALQVSPASPTLQVNGVLQMTAQGTFSDGSLRDVTSLATWTSTNSTLVSVQNAPQAGLVTALAQGSSVVQASLNGIGNATTLTVAPLALVSLQIFPTSANLLVGGQLAFGVNGTLSNGSVLNMTEQMTWTSGNSSILVVSNASGQRGLATCTGVGNATLTAALTIDRQVTANVNVRALGRLYVSSPGPSPSPTASPFGSLGGSSLLTSGNLTAYGPLDSVANNTAPLQVYTPSGLPAQPAVDPGRDIIYLAAGRAVQVFDRASRGQTTPTRLLSFNAPTGVALDPAADRLCVADTDTVYVYDKASQLTSSSQYTRSLKLGGALRYLSLDPTHDRLYASQLDPPGVAVVDNLSVQSLTTSGTRLITGSRTLLTQPLGVFIDPTSQRLFVADPGSQLVDVFEQAANLSGNVPPSRVLQGSATGLSGPTDVLVDLLRDQLVVANGPSNSVLFFGPASTVAGNQAPFKSLSGPATQLLAPAGLALDPTR